VKDSQNTKIYSVTELTGEIQDLIEDRFDFVWVEGEISNFRAPASGHYYMVLKDENSQIRAVMFRLQGRYLKFLPENGMKVIVQGRIGVYAARGEYQIILDYMEPMGVGALALAFEQLKEKLASQGIFDQEIKKPLPFLPQRVAVITSPTGAAVRDFLKVIRRRFSNIEVVIVPVRVQGEGSTRDMVEALELVNKELDVDVIVLTRGGGSLEDLWAFNREELALSIRRSRIPVVSAVGHEIDMTISDLAADLRAPTPSAAAELLVVEKESLLARLNETISRLIGEMTHIIEDHKKELALVSKGLKDPQKRLADIWMRLDEIHFRIARLTKLTLRNAKKKLNTEARVLILHTPTNVMTSLIQRLSFQRKSLSRAVMRSLEEKTAAFCLLNKRIQDLSPLSILRRGYSITRKLPEKTILRDTSGMKNGKRVEVLLGHGQIECRVEKVDPDKEI
jgi:exodeoxyribonuclease VII large subunit